MQFYSWDTSVRDHSAVSMPSRTSDTSSASPLSLARITVLQFDPKLLCRWFV